MANRAAVMGAEGAVNVIHRTEIGKAPEENVKYDNNFAEYKAKFGDPYVAACNGWLDELPSPKKAVGFVEP